MLCTDQNYYAFCSKFIKVSNISHPVEKHLLYLVIHIIFLLEDTNNHQLFEKLIPVHINDCRTNSNANHLTYLQIKHFGEELFQFVNY